MKRDRLSAAHLFLWLLLAVCQFGCASIIQWDKSSEDTSEDAPAEIRFGMARMLERNGSLSDARKVYEGVLQGDPKNSETLHRLGVVALRMEQKDTAVDYFTRAVELEEPTVELLGDLGYTYFLMEEYDAAEKTLRQAIEKAPDNNRIVNNLAIVVGLQGDTEQSLALFRRAGTESEAQSNLAFVLTRLQKNSEAKQHYHEALDRDPTLKAAAKGLAEFYH